VQPTIIDDAVVRFAMVPGMECYSYAEYFEDDAGTLFPMLPPDFVMLLSTNVQNKIVYGAFTQLEDAKSKRFVTYQTARIPFVYGDEEGGALYYRLTACPLPMPSDIMGIGIVEALPGGSGAGPFAKEPFFEADYATDEERQAAAEKALREREEGLAEAENGSDLSEHTVDELRQIAADEDIDLSGADRKADIIKTIKRERKARE
jgi:hypothetical protein